MSDIWQFGVVILDRVDVLCGANSLGTNSTDEENIGTIDKIATKIAHHNLVALGAITRRQLSPETFLAINEKQSTSFGESFVRILQQVNSI